MNTYIYNKVKVSGQWVLGVCFAALLPLTTACNDWLDVEPKSQIKEEAHFDREGGYADQLTGIYTAMTEREMYGLNMGIGFVEVLSHSYDINPNSEWRYVNEFDYREQTAESTIRAIWSKTYNCIANANVLIRNIEKADANMFTSQNYHYYRGQAYGLRGFLHFELMRLFACAPSMDGKAKGVPYVTEYSTEVVGQKSVEETMQLVIGDLLKAHEELAYDTLNAEDYHGSPYYRLPRNYFNYYACALTLAKAYLWLGDTQNALKYANELIEHYKSHEMSPSFSWIHYTAMQTSNRNELDMTFSNEHVFRLTINDWEDIGNYYFTKQGGINALTPSEATAQSIYEVDLGYGNDYRYLKGFEQDGEKRYMAKLWYLAGSTFNNMYPLLRMSEAWYIAAECLKNSDTKRAIGLLNEVRENRNLSLYPLAETLSAEQLQEEIFKEYRKEFVGEHGELFFYYKRLNLPEIKGAATRTSKAVYVLPIPSNDQEFGGYTNE